MLKELLSIKFGFTPGMCDDSQFNLQYKGNLLVEIKFS